MMTKEQQSVLHVLNRKPANLHDIDRSISKESTVPDDLIANGWAQKIGGRYRITPEGEAALGAANAISDWWW